MRNPGTEPLPMISGDVMELHHLIYAEREAHAAEVARLRAALEEIGSCQCPCQPVGNCLVLDEGTGKELRCVSCVARAALAAPPTAAAQAFEGMRKALERLSLGPDCGCKPCVGQCRTKGSLEIELLERIDFACAALAAWKEATRG